jgi:hypothetical protein
MLGRGADRRHPTDREGKVVGICRIQPITLAATPRALYLHFLRTGRWYLPGSALIYDRALAWSLAELLRSRTCWPDMSRRLPPYCCRSPLYCPPRGESANAAPPSLRRPVPPLELDWPHESPIKEVPVYIREREPMDPIYVVGNLLEIII